MSRAHDKQAAEAHANRQKPGGANQSPVSAPVPDAATQSDLFGHLADAQAQELLLRMGGLGGNRGVQSAVTTPVQRAIEVDVPRRGKGPAPEPVDDRLISMVIDGVMAFDELAKYRPAIGQEDVAPAMPAGVPAGLRPAFGHLLRAKQQHFQVGLPDATQLVRERLFNEGAVGVARYLINGPQLVLQEELERAYSAKTQWWLARPIFKALIEKYAATPGANSTEAEKWQSMIGVLDREMTELIPGLVAQMNAAAVPEEAERIKALAEAKESIGVLEGLATVVGGLSEGMSKAQPVVSDRHLGGGIGQDLPKATRFGEPGSKLADDLTPEQESLYFKVSESTTSTTFNKGVAMLGKAKSLVSIYSSGDAIGKAYHKFTDDKSTGIEMAGAAVSITSNVLTPIQEAGNLMFTGAAEICENYASFTRAKHAVNPALGAARVRSLTSSAETFRDLAGKVKLLEKVTGVLGVLSAGLTLAEGIEKNDSESIIGGGADLLSGAVSVAETFKVVAGGTAVFAGIGALQIKTMATVAADMSRALQAIRNADLREALENVGEDLNAAARHAHVFDTAMWEWVMRQNSPDEMERTLGEGFGRNAREQIAPLHNALGSALSSAVQGPISREPSMAKAFSAQFGGAFEARWFFTDLADRASITSTGELMSHAQWLKDNVFPKVSRGFEAIYLEMKKLDKAAKGTVGLW